MNPSDASPNGETVPPIDWRNPETYRRLEMLDQCGWAWEFLRRNPVYMAEAATCRKAVEPMPGAPHVCIMTLDVDAELPSTWGLHFRRKSRATSRWIVCFLACRLRPWRARRCGREG
jgi:Family of unknown function (DUF6499)